jgi:hypothetical protein
MVSKRLYLWTFLVALLFQVVVAHDHHDKLTEEEANAPVDAILWIHIALQATVWGILFPIGMVLGISRSRWHVPLQVRHQTLRISVSNQFAGYGLCIDIRGLHPRSCAQGSDVPDLCTRLFCLDSVRTDICAVSSRNLPQTTYPRKNYQTICCHSTWSSRKDVSCLWLDADAVWRFDVPRVLSWRSFGCVLSAPILFILSHVLERAMPRTLFHGKWIHCICLNYGNFVPCWGGMGEA